MNSINTSLITDNKGKNSSDVNATSEKLERAKKLKEACAGFEGMFFSMMMKGMREATETFGDGAIKKGKAEKIFTDMLDQEYVSQSAKNSSTGIGDTLYKNIISTVNEYKDLQDIPLNEVGVSTQPISNGRRQNGSADKESFNILDKLNELKAMRDNVPQASTHINDFISNIK